jgi:hypothetical protein
MWQAKTQIKDGGVEHELNLVGMLYKRRISELIIDAFDGYDNAARGALAWIQNAISVRCHASFVKK